jgi:hypothetical protein
VSSSAPVTAPASPVSVANSRSRAHPACDTTPFPSALTLTLCRLPLRFTSGVPSCAGMSIIQQFVFPLQQGTSSYLRPVSAY